MPSYEDDLPEFERRNAQVLGISTDSVHSNEAWAKLLGGFSYPLLSDHWPHGYVCAKYGVLRGTGVAERAIFVIDAQGIIRYIDIHDISRWPSSGKILQALDTLK
jgi:peroxiredoxin